MGFQDLVRQAVALIDQQTKSLQDEVTIYPWTGQNVFGEAVLGSGIAVNAIVEPLNRISRTEVGDVVIRARVLVLEEIPSNGAAGRTEPVDLRDKIVLPDGTVGRIVEDPSLTDPADHLPYFHQLFIGTASR